MNMGECLVFKTKNGRSPCHTACLHGHLKILQMILETNMAISEELLNARDSCGSTPLMEAIIADHLDVVKYLMDNYNCVDIYAKDNLENTCLHLSAQSGSLNVFKFMFNKFFKISEFINFNQKVQLIDQFSKCLNKFLMTPLHSSVKVRL